jgi:hypothetical protein
LTGLYLTTPFLLLADWLLNRGTDPRSADANDVIIPQAVRWTIGILGVVTFLISIELLLR